MHFCNKINGEIGFAFRRTKILGFRYSCNHLKELADGSLDHEMFSTTFPSLQRWCLSSEDHWFLSISQKVAPFITPK